MKFSKLIAIVAFTLATALSTFAADKSPRYIFYFIGDGMGTGQVMSAQTYNRMVRNDKRPLVMTQFPVTSLAYTFSASSPVTDSAAAGTALATGNKTKNGMLGMDADSIAVTSMAELLKQNGFGIGLVTSVAPDDATPGAFYAHVPYRGMYYEIEKQAAASGFEFIAGAGLRGLKDSNGNPTDIKEIFRQNDVEIVYGTDGLTETDSRKVLLLSPDTLSPNNIGYTIDSIEGSMTLPKYTQACLDHMMRVSPDKFFMMVEGGNIDHAGHANDGGAIVKEVINFDEALEIAYDFYLNHPDETLIVVTADHETGGMSVGCSYTGYNAFLNYVDYQKVSKEQFSAFCKAIYRSRRIFTWDDMKEYLSENLGFWSHLPVSESQEQTLKEKFDSTFELRNSADTNTLYANFNAFSVEVFNIFNNIAGLGFTTGNHSGNPVPVYAIGVGSELFANGQDNTLIPEKILSTVGLTLKTKKCCGKGCRK
ncbi:MAG: alkaline phosphatase [Muribaculaceae bacterium]|nr:alkaline phosphatase [Muribaculaceae bacterium]